MTKTCDKCGESGAERRLCDMNYRSLMLLGYGLSIIENLTPHANEKQLSKMKWFMNSVINIVYLNKPLDPMP